MAREQLAHGRQLVFRAGGASMWPMIRPNTELTVSPCEPAALTVGRCVLAIHGDGLVVHRIVTVDERRDVHHLGRHGGVEVEEAAVSEQPQLVRLRLVELVLAPLERQPEPVPAARGERSTS